VAFKFLEVHAYNTHTHGLTRALKVLNKYSIRMTPAAEQAIFWLDLVGSMLVDSKCHLSHIVLTVRLLWRREQKAGIGPQMPIRFIRRGDALPDALIDWISDMEEFQDWL